jgi:DNA-binding LytR/AlgR family response regulator
MIERPLKALVVDDEPIARQVLREELEEAEGVEVIGEASSGWEALEHIRSREPDVVFLDLQMPGMGGFDVVRQLDGPHLPWVVVVTAYDQHAIEAFDAGAVDYLLKPVSQQRLEKSLERVRSLRRDARAVAESVARLQDLGGGPPGERGKPKKIVGRLGEEYHLLDSTQVLAFQAERELVWIITRKQRYLATQPLKVLEAKLAGLNFARTHRNSLVNLDHVVKMAPLSSQRWLLTLANQQEFVVSKRQAKVVQRLLGW